MIMTRLCRLNSRNFDEQGIARMKMESWTGVPQGPAINNYTSQLLTYGTSSSQCTILVTELSTALLSFVYICTHHYVTFMRLYRIYVNEVIYISIFATPEFESWHPVYVSRLICAFQILLTLSDLINVERMNIR